MSVGAAIYLPEAASRDWATRRVAGLSVLRRLLLTAVRAGVSEIGLPQALADDPTVAEIRRDPRLALVVYRLAERGISPKPLLLLPASSVVHPGSLRRLLEAAGRGATTALEECKGSPAPVLVVTGEAVPALADRLIAGVPLGEELENRIRSGTAALITGGGYFVAVTDATTLGLAEAALYRSLGAANDSALDRLLNRPCSGLLTRLFVRLPISPNLVTLASLALGLAAAWQVRSGTATSALLGILLYALAVVLDHSDGEIARLTFQESTFGHRLDIAADTTTHALLALAMAGAASRVGGRLTLLAGAFAALGIIVSSILVNFAPLPTERPGQAGQVLARLGTREPFYLVLAGFSVLVWRAEWLLPHLVWLLAGGSQAYWLTYLAKCRLGMR